MKDPVVGSMLLLLSQSQSSLRDNQRQHSHMQQTAAAAAADGYSSSKDANSSTTLVDDNSSLDSRSSPIITANHSMMMTMTSTPPRTSNLTRQLLCRSQSTPDSASSSISSTPCPSPSDKLIISQHSINHSSSDQTAALAAMSQQQQPQHRSLTGQLDTPNSFDFISSMQYAAAVVRCDDLKMMNVNQALLSMFGYGEIDYARLQGPKLSMIFPALQSSRRKSSVAANNSNANNIHSGMIRVLKAKHFDSGKTILIELSLTYLDHTKGHFDSSTGLTSRYFLATMRNVSQLEHLDRASRYHSEFEGKITFINLESYNVIELELMGKGGFGSVYRVRNRIDGQEYAIKKVKLQDTFTDSFTSSLFGSRSSLTTQQSACQQHDEKVFREVKTFAQISNHPNVVRYYAAWTEPGHNSVTDEAICNSSKPWNNMDDVAEEETHHQAVVSSDDDLVFGEAEHHSNNSSAPSSEPLNIAVPVHIAEQNAIMSKPARNKKHKPHSRSLGTSFYGRNISSMHDLNHHPAGKSKGSATLYIQMQLCPFNDLRRWLLNRNKSDIVDVDENNDIFRQIVLGLDHIHRKGFVHKDLTPQNIFIQDGHVYLGDFGLAKSISEKVLTDSHSATHSIAGDTCISVGDSRDAVGTFLYTSPEQLSCGPDSSKMDIYALGMIMVELFHPFATSMERAVVLSSLKTDCDKNFPAQMDHLYPEYASLARLMLDPVALNRPSTGEILNSSLFSGYFLHVTSPSLVSSSMSINTHFAHISDAYGSPMSNGTHFHMDASGTPTDLVRWNHFRARRWSSVDAAIHPHSPSISSQEDLRRDSLAQNKLKPLQLNRMPAIFYTPVPSPYSKTQFSPYSPPQTPELAAELDAAKSRVQELENQVARMSLELDALRAVSRIPHDKSMTSEIRSPISRRKSSVVAKRSSSLSLTTDGDNLKTVTAAPSLTAEIVHYNASSKITTCGRV